MVEIRLTNSKTRKKEVFEPLDPQNVRMYLCGPTVYDRAHLGNARPVVVFDVLYRLLRHVYGDSAVTYVRNFTDVDDKINARAAATGRSIREITDETIRWYHDDMDALGALRPDHEPRATDYIPQMVAMIVKLIADGHAYEANGHVLFDVRSYSDYGKLSGRSVDDMIAGARVEVAPFKRDPMDFVLWKPSSDGEPGWESPWGRGRPGWHIECSAMSEALLGRDFDIHGGGLDLLFPHHENELAQSCCAYPEHGFARVWLHNEMLQVEGKKMSKSLGNFFTVRDLLDQGVPGEVIRYVMLMTHYRKPMDWTAEKVREAEATLRKWRDLLSNVEAAPKPANSVLDTLADDLNTPGVISILHALQDDPSLLKASATFLGLLGGVDEKEQPKFTSDAFELANLIFSHRAQARKVRDWQKSDILRAWLQISGFSVQDKGEGRLVTTTEEEPFGWQTLAQYAQKGDDRVPVGVLIKLAESRGVDLKLEASDPVGAIYGRLNPPINLEYLRVAATALGLR